MFVFRHRKIGQTEKSTGDLQDGVRAIFLHGEVSNMMRAQHDSRVGTQCQDPGLQVERRRDGCSF